MKWMLISTILTGCSILFALFVLGGNIYLFCAAAFFCGLTIRWMQNEFRKRP